jgi:hypothetical protein
MPVIPAAWEAEARRSPVKAHRAKLVRSHLKRQKSWGHGSNGRALDSLPLSNISE